MKCEKCGSENPETVIVCECGNKLNNGNHKSKNPNTGMFQEADYIPFMLGIFIIGGLIALPLSYGYQLNMKYFASLPWALLSCAVFLIAFRRDGTFSLGRAIPAIAGLMIGAQIYNTKTGKPAFAAGGILGFLILVICGFAGLYIGKLVRKHLIK